MRKKKSSCLESSRHPTENYYAHAASFTQKHTIVEKLPTSAFAVPHLCRASAFENVGSRSERLPSVDQACSTMPLI